MSALSIAVNGTGELIPLTPRASAVAVESARGSVQVYWESARARSTIRGYRSHFRRSGLVALNVEDLAFGAEGLQITLRRSKTDQEGEGRAVAIPFGSNASACPVNALRARLDAAVITTGPVFRGMRRHGVVIPARLSDHAVAVVVKRYATVAGLDSGRAIMRQTGHKSIELVLRYVPQSNVFHENALNGLGL